MHKKVTPTHIELLQCHSIVLKGRVSQAKGETEVTLMFVKTTVHFLQYVQNQA